MFVVLECGLAVSGDLAVSKSAPSNKENRQNARPTPAEVSGMPIGPPPEAQDVWNLLWLVSCTALRRSLVRSMFAIAAAHSLMPRSFLGVASPAGLPSRPIPPLVVADRIQAVLTPARPPLAFLPLLAQLV